MSNSIDEILDSMMFEEDEETRFRSKLAKKLPPYSEENTVHFWGYGSYFLDPDLKTDAKGYRFVEILRTFPLWDEEIKIIIDGVESKVSFNIPPDSTVLVPYRLEDLVQREEYYQDRDKMKEEAEARGIGIGKFDKEIKQEYDIKLKELKEKIEKEVIDKFKSDKKNIEDSKVKKEIKREVDRTFAVRKSEIPLRPGAIVTTTETIEKDMVHINLDFDIIRFNYRELEFVQKNSKPDILNSNIFSPVNKEFLKYYYGLGNKYKLPGDIICNSLFQITRSYRGNYYGFPVLYLSEANKQIAGKKGVKVYIKNVMIDELKDLNWYKEGFDFYPIRLSYKKSETEYGRKTVTRKDFVTRFRNGGIILIEPDKLMKKKK